MSTFEKMFWIMLVFGLLGRFLVTPYGVYANDMKYWVDWGQTLVNENFSQYFMLGWTDRLPGGILYVLWLLAGLQKVFVGLSNEFIFKLPANISDAVLAFLIFRFVGKKWGEEKGFLAFLLFFFNPFVWHVSALWGQMDSVQALLMLLVIFALFRNWYGVSIALLVFAAQFKPHSILLAPIVFIYLWQTREGWRDFGQKIGAAVLVFLGVWWILSVPFLPNTAEYSGDAQKIIGPFKLGWQQWVVARDIYPYASANAFNFWGAMRQSWKTDMSTWAGIKYGDWGLIMFALTGTAILWQLLRKKGKPHLDNYFYTTALLSLLAFTFLTRVHERHIFPFFLFYLLVIWQRPYRIISYALITLIMVANTIFAYGWATGRPWLEPNGAGMTFLSLLLLGVVLFQLFWVRLSGSE